MISRSSTQASQNSGRILIVDDDPLISRVLDRLLSREYSTVTENSARDALARIAGGEVFDLVLCDLMMPEMDGRTFYEEVRAMGYGEEEKLIFLTGGVFTDRMESFLRAIPNPHILKPFKLKELTDLVQIRVQSTQKAA